MKHNLIYHVKLILFALFHLVEYLFFSWLNNEHSYTDAHPKIMKQFNALREYSVTIEEELDRIKLSLKHKKCNCHRKTGKKKQKQKADENTYVSTTSVMITLFS